MKIAAAASLIILASMASQARAQADAADLMTTKAVQDGYRAATQAMRAADFDKLKATIFIANDASGKQRETTANFLISLRQLAATGAKKFGAPAVDKVPLGMPDSVIDGMQATIDKSIVRVTQPDHAVLVPPDQAAAGKFDGPHLVRVDKTWRLDLTALLMSTDPKFKPRPAGPGTVDQIAAIAARIDAGGYASVTDAGESVDGLMRLVASSDAADLVDAQAAALARASVAAATVAWRDVDLQGLKNWVALRDDPDNKQRDEACAVLVVIRKVRIAAVKKFGDKNVTRAAFGPTDADLARMIASAPDAPVIQQEAHALIVKLSQDHAEQNVTVIRADDKWKMDITGYVLPKGQPPEKAIAAGVVFVRLMSDIEKQIKDGTIKSIEDANTATDAASTQLMK